MCNAADNVLWTATSLSGEPEMQEIGSEEGDKKEPNITWQWNNVTVMENEKPNNTIEQECDKTKRQVKNTTKRQNIDRSREIEENM